MAAVSIVPLILDYFDEETVRSQILPKTKEVYKKNGGDVKIVLAVLACISRILTKMDKMVIVEEVLPILFDVKLGDVNVLVRVLGQGKMRSRARMTLIFSLAEIYQMMMGDSKRFGLTVNVLATRVLPLLIPQLVNTQLQ